MEKQKIDFYELGRKKGKEIELDIQKYAHDIEVKYGKKALEEFQVGVSLSFGDAYKDKEAVGLNEMFVEPVDINDSLGRRK